MQHVVSRLEGIDESFVGALVRLEEDEASHVDLATAVLKKLGVPAFKVPSEATVIGLQEEPAQVSLMRLVVTGLCICESVSAARFASVREHTDLVGCVGTAWIFSCAAGNPSKP